MKWTYGAAAFVSLGLTAPFWCGVGLARQESQQGGVAAKAGEKLDEFGRAIKLGIVNAEGTVRDGLNKTGETVRESFAKTRDSVNAMGLGPRVYGRLHWDKSLHSTSLFIKVEGSRVTLRGVVPDEATEAKALALAGETVGVSQVIDQLTVLAPTKSNPDVIVPGVNSKR
jgi:hyperosmotically inducible periplasmic protein